jgi:outer membrane protein
MSKKIISYCMLLLGFSFSLSVRANDTNLIDVYQQALTSDPTYQQAIYQSLSDKENFAINLASLLPQASIAGAPNLTKQSLSGSGLIQNTTAKGYLFTLTLSQAIFDFAKISATRGAHALNHSADATLNAATQQLMLRTAKAYFTVLKDEDTLAYSLASKRAFAKQYDQVNQQYRVGIKTITDVYTAKASFDIASAGYIGAQTTLAVDKENLRAITGNTYTRIAKLSEQFPLVSPQPATIESWVSTALNQNWAIKAERFRNQAALAAIKQQQAGHLPVVYLQGNYSTGYNNVFTGNTSLITRNPVNSPNSFSSLSGHTKQASISLNLGMPIFSGGQVVAQVRQAHDNYTVASQRLEQTVRSVATQTRQYYLEILAGIQKIHADQLAIKSSISSLEGLEARYHSGTETLVDVLNQREKVLQAQTDYATDRYAYVSNLLALKEAVGTLSQDDLLAINQWLGR